MIPTIRILFFLTLLAASSFRAEAEDITNALHAFLQHRIEVEKKGGAIVIGIVDERGSRVVGCGRMDNGTDQQVDGDTIFEIGSVTKTFTTLLLQDMVERGEVKLDDPVAKYLPASVKMPTRNGREITLLHLATHTSGLPLVPDNLNPKRADNPYAEYSMEKMNAFLAGYKLKQNPGTKFEYSEFGMELLGHALALKAGTNYESLVMDRICRPLKMDSTRITLPPELKSRTATGHDPLGHPLPGLAFQALVGGSGLHSTANDLLKYLSANLGLTPCSLTPVMERTHAIHFHSVIQRVNVALGWVRPSYPGGREFIVHGGATPGYTTFIGFEKSRHRGVVVLCSTADHMDAVALGLYLLISEWDPDRRPHETKIERQDYESVVGEYQLSSNLSLGVLALRMLYILAPKLIICASTVSVVLLIILLHRYVGFFRKRWNKRVARWRAYSARTRRIITSCGICAVALSPVITLLIASWVVCSFAHPVVNIRRDGDRIFIQATSSSHVPSRVQLPHITGELSPESGAQFFERLSGIPVTFSRDAQGRVTRMSAPLFGNTLSCVKISDKPVESSKSREVVRLDPKVCDACVGRYEFAPDDLFPTGLRLTVHRLGDELVGQASSTNGSYGVFNIYPQSETNFFFTLTVVGVDLTFVKNGKGEITSVIRHVDWLPNATGRKLSVP